MNPVLFNVLFDGRAPITLPAHQANLARPFRSLVRETEEKNVVIDNKPCSNDISQKSKACGGADIPGDDHVDSTASDNVEGFDDDKARFKIQRHLEVVPNSYYVFERSFELVSISAHEMELYNGSIVPQCCLVSTKSRVGTNYVFSGASFPHLKVRISL